MVEPDSLDVAVFKVVLVVKQECPYKDGMFEFILKYSEGYIFEPPQVVFLTKIFHPNIKKD